MKPSSTSVDAIAVKFDFHTDDDAANTTTGADAMTSATGVELDCVMPINQWSRRLSRLRDIERWASARYRNRRPDSRTTRDCL